MKQRRCTIEDIHAVSATLGEPLAIQSQTWRPHLGDAPIMLVKNSTDTRWFRELADAATAICFPRGRIVYPLQGSALLYSGTQVEKFLQACSPLGFVGRKGDSNATGKPCAGNRSAASDGVSAWD